MLSGPDYLAQLAGNGGRVVVTALIEFVWAVTAAGIAIGLYPVLRRYSPALALGAVAGRMVEGMLVLVGTSSLLVLLTLGQASVAAGSAAASSYQVAGNALLAVRDWVDGFVMSLAFLAGALMYYVVLYRSRLVPRWLSGWGLVAVVLSVVATLYAGFTQEFGFSTVNNVLSIPIFAQEMVLGVWLIVKGFSRTALASAAATEEGSA